jgi:hypothetical protein
VPHNGPVAVLLYPFEGIICLKGEKLWHYDIPKNLSATP